MQISKATQAESTSNRLDWPNRVSNLVASIRGAFICINFQWDGSKCSRCQKEAALPDSLMHRVCDSPTNIPQVMQGWFEVNGSSRTLQETSKPKTGNTNLLFSSGHFGRQGAVRCAGQQLWRASLEWWCLESAKRISPNTTDQDSTGHCRYMLMPILTLDCKE